MTTHQRTPPSTFSSYWPQTAWLFSPSSIFAALSSMWLLVPKDENSTEEKDSWDSRENTSRITHGVKQAETEKCPWVFPGLALVQGSLSWLPGGLLEGWWRNVTPTVSLQFFKRTVQELWNIPCTTAHWGYPKRGIAQFWKRCMLMDKTYFVLYAVYQLWNHLTDNSETNQSSEATTRKYVNKVIYSD